MHNVEITAVKLSPTIYLPGSLVLSNLSTAAISVLLPHLLIGLDYALFSVSWVTGQLFSSILFEWLRSGLVRFSVGNDQNISYRRRSSIFVTYSVFFSAFLLLGSLICVNSGSSELSFSVGLGLIFSATQAVFEASTSLSRAQSRNRDYATALLFRSFAAVFMVVLVAWITRSAALSFIALCASYLLAFITPLFRFKFHRSMMISFDIKELLLIFRYGTFAALSTSMVVAMPAVVRWVSAGDGEDSAGLFLAMDLAQKAIMIIGLAVSLLPMQKAIITSEFGTDLERAESLGMQIFTSALFVIPATFGFIAIQPSFGSLLVPSDLQDQYFATVTPSILWAGLVTFRAYCLDTIFLVIGKSRLSIFGPGFAILVFLLLMSPKFYGVPFFPTYMAIAAAVGALFGMVLSILLALRTAKVNWPVTDVMKILVSSATMGCCVYTVSNAMGANGLVLSLAVGGTTYLVSCYCLKVSGVRALTSSFASKCWVVASRWGGN